MEGLSRRLLIKLLFLKLTGHTSLQRFQSTAWDEQGLNIRYSNQKYVVSIPKR